MIEEIGTVRNFADAEDLRYLALFKDSVSEIQLIQGGIHQHVQAQNILTASPSTHPSILSAKNKGKC